MNQLISELAELLGSKDDPTTFGNGEEQYKLVVVHSTPWLVGGTPFAQSAVQLCVGMTQSEIRDAIQSGMNGGTARGLSVGGNDVGPNVGPFRLPGYVGGGGGMYVGEDDPMFHGNPMQVPPGARFDPLHPFDTRRVHGRGRARGLGEPEPDHLPMPGRRDDFDFI